MVEKVWIREGIMAEGPEGAALAANRCNACGQVYFPKAGQDCLIATVDQLSPLRHLYILRSAHLDDVAIFHNHHTMADRMSICSRNEESATYLRGHCGDIPRNLDRAGVAF